MQVKTTMGTYLRYHRKSSNGFTIVELLIVIVVIGILATIVIVAYNGIQNNAKASASQAAVSQAGTKLSTYAVDNSDNYPATLDLAGIVDTNGTSYQYSVNNTSTPKTYCVTATTGTVSYYQSSTGGKPVAGTCVTNLVGNPSVTVDSAGWSATGDFNAGSRVFVGGEWVFTAPHEPAPRQRLYSVVLLLVQPQLSAVIHIQHRQR